MSTGLCIQPWVFNLNPSPNPLTSKLHYCQYMIIDKTYLEVKGQGHYKQISILALRSKCFYQKLWLSPFDSLIFLSWSFYDQLLLQEVIKEVRFMQEQGCGNMIFFYLAIGKLDRNIHLPGAYAHLPNFLKKILLKV